MEFEILWDGSHSHTDRDLLCTPKIPQKRAAPPLHPAVQLNRGDSSLALVRQCLQHQSCTRVQLQAFTELSPSAVDNAISRLLRQDAIRVVGMVPDPRQRWNGRRYRVYAIQEAA